MLIIPAEKSFLFSLDKMFLAPRGKEDCEMAEITKIAERLTQTPNIAEMKKEAIRLSKKYNPFSSS